MNAPEHNAKRGNSELIEWRVRNIEKGHQELSKAVSDLRDFANSIRTYARLALLVWPIAQAGITALVVSILLHR